MLDNLLRHSFPYPLAAIYHDMESITYPEGMEQKYNRLVDLYDCILKTLNYSLLGLAFHNRCLTPRLKKELETTLKNPVPSNWTALLATLLEGFGASKVSLVEKIRVFYYSPDPNLSRVRDGVYYLLQKPTSAREIKDITIARFFEDFNLFIGRSRLDSLQAYGKAVEVLLPVFREILEKLEFFKDYAMVYVPQIQLEGHTYDHVLDVFTGVAPSRMRYTSEKPLPERNRKMYLFQVTREGLEPMFCLHPFITVHQSSKRNYEIYYLRYQHGDEMDYISYQCEERFRPERLLIDFHDTMDAFLEGRTREVSDDVIELFREILKTAWKDRVLSDSERSKIDYLKDHFGVSDKLLNNLEDMVKRELGITQDHVDLKVVRKYETLLKNSIIKSRISPKMREFLDGYRIEWGIPHLFAKKLESEIWYEEGLKFLAKGNSALAYNCFFNSQLMDEENLPAREKVQQLAPGVTPGIPAPPPPKIPIVETVQMAPPLPGVETPPAIITLELQPEKAQDTVTIEGAVGKEKEVKGPVIKVTDPIYKPRGKSSKILKASASTSRASREPEESDETYEQEFIQETEEIEEETAREEEVKATPPVEPEAVEPEAYPMPEDYNTPELLHNSPGVIEDDILNWDALLKSLEEDSDPSVKRVWNLLTESCRDLIDAWRENGKLLPQLKAGLIEGLNDIIESSDFYNSTDFASIEISDMGLDLVERGLDKLPVLVLQMFNRQLLESVFPRELARRDYPEDQEIYPAKPEPMEEKAMEKPPEEKAPEEAEKVEEKPVEEPAPVEEKEEPVVEEKPVVKEKEPAPEAKKPEEEKPVEEPGEKVEPEASISPVEESHPDEAEAAPEETMVEEKAKPDKKTSKKKPKVKVKVKKTAKAAPTEEPGEKDTLADVITEEERSQAAGGRFEITAEIEAPSLEEEIKKVQEMRKKEESEEETSSEESDIPVPRGASMLVLPESMKAEEEETEEASEAVDPLTDTNILPSDEAETLPKAAETPAKDAKSPSRDPAKVGQLLAKAKSNLQREDYARARKLCNQILKLDPDNLVAKLLRGKCNIEEENYEEAYDDLSDVLAIKGEDPTLLLLHGRAALEMGHLTEALADLSEVTGKVPSNPEGWLLQGMVFLEEGKFKKAIKNFNRAIKLNPDDPEAYLNRGNVHIETWEYEKAMDDYNRAIKLDPEDPYFYFQRGNAHFLMREYQLALKDFSRALELDSQDMDFYINRGVTYIKLKQFEEAKKDLNYVIETGEDIVQALIQRGRLFKQLGENVEALKDFSRLIDMEPDNPEGYSLRGFLLVEMGKHEDAMEDFEEAIAINGEFVEAYHGKANTYLAMGNYDEAIETYTHVLELDPQLGEAHLNRGVAYEKKGDMDKAREDFLKYMETNRLQAEPV